MPNWFLLFQLLFLPITIPLVIANWIRWALGFRFYIGYPLHLDTTAPTYICNVSRTIPHVVDDLTQQMPVKDWVAKIQDDNPGQDTASRRQDLESCRLVTVEHYRQEILRFVQSESMKFTQSAFAWDMTTEYPHEFVVLTIKTSTDTRFLRFERNTPSLNHLISKENRKPTLHDLLFPGNETTMIRIQEYHSVLTRDASLIAKFQVDTSVMDILDVASLANTIDTETYSSMPHICMWYATVFFRALHTIVAEGQPNSPPKISAGPSFSRRGLCDPSNLGLRGIPRLYRMLRPRLKVRQVNDTGRLLQPTETELQEIVESCTGALYSVTSRAEPYTFWEEDRRDLVLGIIRTEMNRTDIKDVRQIVDEAEKAFAERKSLLG